MFIDYKINADLQAYKADTFHRAINVMYPPSPLVPAKGDLVNDDTSAIQAIINYLIALGGGMVFFPNGNYKIMTALVINGPSVSLIGESVNSKIRNLGTGDSIKVMPDNPSIASTPMKFMCTISNLFILGNATSQHGINIQAGYTVTLNKLVITQHGQAGVYSKWGMLSTIRDCEISNNNWGIFLDDFDVNHRSTTWSIEGKCTLPYNNLAAIVFNGGDTNTVIGAALEATSGGPGMIIQNGCVNPTLINVYTESNVGSSLVIDNTGGNGGVAFNCRFADNNVVNGHVHLVNSSGFTFYNTWHDANIAGGGKNFNKDNTGGLDFVFLSQVNGSIPFSDVGKKIAYTDTFGNFVNFRIAGLLKTGTVALSNISTTLGNIATVTFPSAYPVGVVPVVTVEMTGLAVSALTTITVAGISNTGFTITGLSGSANQATFNWSAIDPNKV